MRHIHYFMHLGRETFFEIQMGIFFLNYGLAFAFLQITFLMNFNCELRVFNQEKCSSE